jgi:hypothetical protein
VTEAIVTPVLNSGAPEVIWRSFVVAYGTAPVEAIEALSLVPAAERVLE